MKFIDSTIIILAFTNNCNKEKCRNALRRGGITNSLVLVESFSSIERITKNKILATKSIKGILGNLKIISVDNNVIFEALKKTEKSNLKFFDLIHYVTASLYNCTSILSYDCDFDRLEIRREEP